MIATCVAGAPALAFAAAPKTFQELAKLLIELINLAIVALVISAIVIYFLGVSTNIMSFSEDGREKLKTYFAWGLAILFVMFSIWGILALLSNTLFPGSINGVATHDVARAQQT